MAQVISYLTSFSNFAYDAGLFALSIVIAFVGARLVRRSVRIVGYGGRWDYQQRLANDVRASALSSDLRRHRG